MTCKECIKKFGIINNTLAARFKSRQNGGTCVRCNKLPTKDNLQTTTTTKPKVKVLPAKSN
ncbi:hypothetical protein BAPKO_4532 (plasmid) [Borreliella afzelii PKo]|nr:hypothetical protein BAPKO_4532 [Borreliella afzelii PKo]